MKLFISCRSSLIGFLWLLMHIIISSANSQTLISFLPICILLISSCCLIAPARTSSTQLNTYEENEHPCIFPGFNGIGSCISPFNLTLSVGLLYIALNIFRYGPWVPDLNIFSLEGVLYIVKLWPQLEKMHLNLKRLEVPGCGEAWWCGGERWDNQLVMGRVMVLGEVRMQTRWG